MASTQSNQSNQSNQPIQDDAESDKISLTTDVSKRLAELVRDPTRGQTLEADLRNKLRQEYFEDLLTSIDVLSLIAHSAEGFHDIIAIKKKLDSGKTPTF